MIIEGGNIMSKKRIVIMVSMGIIIASTSYLYFKSCVFSQRIKKIDSFSQVTDVLRSIDKNSLVLFDVDDTLIVPATVSLRSRTKEQHQKQLKKIVENIFTPLSKSEDYYFGIQAITEIPLLIEPAVVNIIQSLQDRGIKTLALTLLGTGSQEQIPFLPEWRSVKLQQVGVDFSKANIPDKIFTELPVKNGTYPMLYHGILATNFGSKGTTLGAFLDYMKWKPSQVIFFDDSLKRVNEVAQEMCKRNIPFIGYHYQGAEYVPGEFDKDITILQFKHLVEYEKWLSDDEARKLIVNQISKQKIPKNTLKKGYL